MNQIQVELRAAPALFEGHHVMPGDAAYAERRDDALPVDSSLRFVESHACETTLRRHSSSKHHAGKRRHVWRRWTGIEPEFDRSG